MSGSFEEWKLVSSRLTLADSSQLDVMSQIIIQYIVLGNTKCAFQNLPISLLRGIKLEFVNTNTFRGQFLVSLPACQYSTTLVVQNIVTCRDPVRPFVAFFLAQRNRNHSNTRDSGTMLTSSPLPLMIDMDM